MIITYHGGNYFKIQSGEISFLIDPLNQRAFKGAAVAINTIKPSAVDFSDSSNGACFWIDHQGEYEKNGIHISGWSIGNENGIEKTAYLVDFDDVKFAILGHATGELPKDFIERFEGTDVMIVPAGGKPFIAQAELARFIRQIEPSIIIPSLFSDIGLFLKEFNGQDKPRAEEKFVFKKKDLTSGAMEIKHLEDKK